MSAPVARDGAAGPRITLLTARGHDEPWLRRRARGRLHREPEKHVSRSYCHPYAVVAVHAGPVGIDIERVEADDMELLESIATPGESRRRGS